MKQISEIHTCIGPCGREFRLETELQQKNGMTKDGYLCGVCRYNQTSENIPGFKPKRWKE